MRCFSLRTPCRSGLIEICFPFRGASRYSVGRMMITSSAGQASSTFRDWVAYPLTFIRIASHIARKPRENLLRLSLRLSRQEVLQSSLPTQSRLMHALHFASLIRTMDCLNCLSLPPPSMSFVVAHRCTLGPGSVLERLPPGSMPTLGDDGRARLRLHLSGVPQEIHIAHTRQSPGSVLVSFSGVPLSFSRPGNRLDRLRNARSAHSTHATAAEFRYSQDRCRITPTL